MEALLPESEVVQHTPPHNVPAYPTLKESWAVLVWFLLVSLVVGVPLYLLFQQLLSTQKQLTTILLSVATETALIFFLLWKAGSRRPKLQLRGHEIPWLYVVLPVLVIAQLLVLSPIHYLHLPDWVKANIARMMERPLLGFIMLCVVAPVLEEIIFRGVLLTGLLRNYRPWVAIGQTALLFGLIHMNPLQIVGAGLLGLSLGWLYYRTRSLLLCMVMHALNNFMAFWSMLSNKLPDEQAPHESFNSVALYGAMWLGAALVVAYILWRVQQATTPVTRAEAVPNAEEHRTILSPEA
jgi:membrane protease YdiL (CAAX protease family)